MEQRIRSCKAGDVAERRPASDTSVDKLQGTSDAGLSSPNVNACVGLPPSCSQPTRISSGFGSGITDARQPLLYNPRQIQQTRRIL